MTMRRSARNAAHLRTKPRTAKAAGIGALVCVIAYVLMYVAAAVLGISAAVYAY